MKLLTAEIRHWDPARGVGYIRRISGGRDVRFTAAVVGGGSAADIKRGAPCLVEVTGGFAAGEPRVIRLVLVSVSWLTPDV